MIELTNDGLTFKFPEIHPEATLRVVFQRTLRIPDDGRDYPLPPGFGAFPLRHVDDFASKLDKKQLLRGGVMLPMYQSEAMWLQFHANFDPERGANYPFALKIAAGKIDAVSGEPWKDKLRSGRKQDYVVIPGQPWLDGYAVEEGVIRQFVAMPLGSGYSAEEQLTGEAEFGGVQLMAIPMKREAYERLFPKRVRTTGMARAAVHLDACQDECFAAAAAPAAAPMALAPGGRMRQEIYKDPFKAEDWAADAKSRCFVHLVNSLAWRTVTGAEPPATPISAQQYASAGLPWFDYYDDGREALPGSKTLDKLKSVAEMAKKKKEIALPDNTSVAADKIVKLRLGLGKDQVREF